MKRGIQLLTVVYAAILVGTCQVQPTVRPASNVAPAPVLEAVLLGYESDSDYDVIGELPKAEFTPLATVDLENAPFHARIRVKNVKAKTISLGSGTLFHDNGRFAAVLSASHVFDDSREDVTVDLGGTSYPATFITRDAALDYAVVAIHSPGVEPATVAAKAQVGGEFRICGFGGGADEFAVMTGDLSGGIRNVDTGMESATLLVAARQGDSGGGVFNERGELAGVVWGSNGEFSAFVSIQKAKDFLRKAVDRVDRIRPARDRANRLVVVSSEGCSHCQRLKPILDELIQEGYAVEVVDARYYVGPRVRVYPTLLFYSGSRLVQRWEGFLDKSGIARILAKGGPKRGKYDFSVSVSSTAPEVANRPASRSVCFPASPRIDVPARRGVCHSGRIR